MYYEMYLVIYEVYTTIRGARPVAFGLFLTTNSLSIRYPNRSYLQQFDSRTAINFLSSYVPFCVIRCVCVGGDDDHGSGVLGTSSATDLFAAPSAARFTHAVSQDVRQTLHDVA